MAYGCECKVCGRPFTVFKWTPGAGMRYKKTEICQGCAKIKNLCQTCILDLEFGQPIQVRDTILKIENDVPRSDVNKEYYVENMSKNIGNDPLPKYTSAGSGVREFLKKISASEPYYKRNLPHLCSFYATGNCKRGNECPYRHELPPDNNLANQNIKDRYYGHNDVVAQKILDKIKKDIPESPLKRKYTPPPPLRKSIPREAKKAK